MRRFENVYDIATASLRLRRGEDEFEIKAELVRNFVSSIGSKELDIAVRITIENYINGGGLPESDPRRMYIALVEGLDTFPQLVPLIEPFIPHLQPNDLVWTANNGSLYKKAMKELGDRIIESEDEYIRLVKSIDTILLKTLLTQFAKVKYDRFVELTRNVYPGDRKLYTNYIGEDIVVLAQYGNRAKIRHYITNYATNKIDVVEWIFIKASIA